MKNILRTISLLCTIFVGLQLSGCAHYQVDFYLTHDTFRPKGKSIAVLTGTKEPHNLEIASQVTESLRKTSRYQVLPQLAVSKVVQPYPQAIKGPYKSAYFQIDTDWDMGDRQKIAQIQRALGVDYLYVIWAPIAVSNGGSSIYQVPAVAQMFEQSTGSVVAQTEIMLLWGGEKNQYVKEGTDEISAQLAEKTGMAVAKRN